MIAFQRPKSFLSLSCQIDSVETWYSSYTRVAAQMQGNLSVVFPAFQLSITSCGSKMSQSDCKPVENDWDWPDVIEIDWNWLSIDENSERKPFKLPPPPKKKTCFWDFAQKGRKTTPIHLLLVREYLSLLSCCLLICRLIPEQPGQVFLNPFLGEPVVCTLDSPLHTKGLPNRTLLFSSYFRSNSCSVMTEPICFCQKNPRAHKNKIGTPPPPKPKNTPPKKRGILWTWRFSCRKNTEILGAHQIGTAISGPRIADTNFTDTRIFLILELFSRGNMCEYWITKFSLELFSVISVKELPNRNCFGINLVVFLCVMVFQPPIPQKTTEIDNNNSSKNSHIMRCLGAFKASTFGITWCDPF